MLNLKTMRAPVTPNHATFTVAGNQPKPTGDPTVVSDANVYPIPLVTNDAADLSAGKFSNLQEVEEFWQMQLDSDSLTSDCKVTIWAWNVWTEEWHRWAVINYKGDSLADSAHGGVWTDNGILGSSHIGVQVEDHAGQELYVTHMWS
jgi:hypothetical protein